MSEVEVLFEEKEFKVVEEDLQHREKELAESQVSIHTQKVMQVVEGFFLEEEEAKAEEEKLDAIDVISFETKLMNVDRMWGQIREM